MKQAQLAIMKLNQCVNVKVPMWKQACYSEWWAAVRRQSSRLIYKKIYSILNRSFLHLALTMGGENFMYALYFHKSDLALIEKKAKNLTSVLKTFCFIKSFETLTVRK